MIGLVLVVAVAEAVAEVWIATKRLVGCVLPRIVFEVERAIVAAVEVAQLDLVAYARRAPVNGLSC